MSEDEVLPAAASTNDEKTRSALEKTYTDAELLTLSAAWIRRCLTEVGVPTTFAMTGGRLCIMLAKKLVEHGHGKVGEDVNAIFDAALKDLFPSAAPGARSRIVIPR